MRWVYLGRGPLVRPHRRKSFMRSPFSKGPSVRGVLQSLTLTQLNSARIINYAATKKDVCKFATMQQIRGHRKKKNPKKIKKMLQIWQNCNRVRTLLKRFPVKNTKIAARG